MSFTDASLDAKRLSALALRAEAEVVAGYAPILPGGPEAAIEWIAKLHDRAAEAIEQAMALGALSAKVSSADLDAGGRCARIHRERAESIRRAMATVARAWPEPAVNFPVHTVGLA